MQVVEQAYRSQGEDIVVYPVTSRTVTKIKIQKTDWGGGCNLIRMSHKYRMLAVCTYLL